MGEVQGEYPPQQRLAVEPVREIAHECVREHPGEHAAKVMMPTHSDASVSSQARYPRMTIRAHAAAPEHVVAIHIVR